MASQFRSYARSSGDVLLGRCRKQRLLLVVLRACIRGALRSASGRDGNTPPAVATTDESRIQSGDGAPDRCILAGVPCRADGGICDLRVAPRPAKANSLIFMLAVRGDSACTHALQGACVRFIRRGQERMSRFRQSAFANRNVAAPARMLRQNRRRRRMRSCRECTRRRTDGLANIHPLQASYFAQRARRCRSR